MIYVSTFVFLKILGPGVHMEDISDIIVTFFTILFFNIMIKSEDIYFSINSSESLLTHINIHQWRINSQHYMLDHPSFNGISIDTPT